MSYQAVRTVAAARNVTLFGDVHGKVSALERVLRERSIEAELAAGNHDVVLVGDLVDRGPRERRGEQMVNVGVETVIDRVLELRRRFPQRIHAVAGNHELMHVRDILGRKLQPGDTSSWSGQGQLTLTAERIEFLTQLPLVLVLQVGEVRGLAVHAGPPERADALTALQEARDMLDAHDRTSAGKQMLWSNPTWSLKSQSFGYSFTRLHVAAFLAANDARFLIRGHTDEPEVMPLPGGGSFICVHTAQGNPATDDPAAGCTYVAWDPPAPPRLVHCK